MAIAPLPDRVVLDTGALIALTDAAMGRSQNQLARALIARMRSRSSRMRVFAPAVVLAEWWRGEDGPAALVRDAVTMLDVPRDVAIEAGRLLAAIPPRKQPSRLFVVDALVVVGGARVAENILTGDPNDIALLRDKLVEKGVLAKGALRVHPI